MADKRKQPQAQTSLLLSPPGSGFSFGQSDANTLLLPVAQTDDTFQRIDAERDNFVGQVTDQNTEPLPFNLFQHSLNKPNSASSDPFAELSHSLTSESNPNSQPFTSNLPTSQSDSSPNFQPSNVSVPLEERQPHQDLNINYPNLPTSEYFKDHPPLFHSSSGGAVQERPQIPAPDPRRPSGNILYSIPYQPIQPHWFFCKEIEKRKIWLPFSLLDSVHLEEQFNSGSHNDDAIVPTNGGRYDVNLLQRTRTAVYWEEDPSIVRRCTWFFRSEGEKRYVPYEEHFAEKLEEEYRIAVTSNTWHRRLEFPGGETIIIHNPNVIVHFQSSSTPDEWGNISEGQLRPRVVKRGIEEFDNIEDGEPIQIDHLVFVVHGIGGFCDLKFRTVTEVVDDFRSIGNSLLRTHFMKHVEDGTIGRVEFLPISWHKTLHGDATGIDSQLHPITLNSIPKLRYFANDTILDVLFYTSPVYCQTIINQVGSEINRMYHQFIDRNPAFSGNVSLIGHSLGSVILFDLLLHQRKISDASNENDDEFENFSRESSPEIELSPIASDDENSSKGTPPKEMQNLHDVLKELSLEDYSELFEKEKIDFDSLMLCSETDIKDLGLPLGPRKKLITYLMQKKEETCKKLEKSEKTFSGLHNREKFPRKPKLIRRHSLSTVNYMVGFAGTGQPFVSYPSLDFQPSCFFALGSPNAMFLTVRGLNTIRNDFRLPTCPAYYNIFHPFDPVAYRMEPLVDPSFTLKPVLIPHHKGRKRMHLEIKESLARVGNDLKQMLVDSLKSTWNSINEFARAHKTIAAQVEAEMNKISNEQMKSDDENDSDSESVTSSTITSEVPEEFVQIGKLNGGRRFDYVLQEKPIESFNEYLFALQSHTCYWESEDTVLLVLKEVYSTMDIHPNLIPSPSSRSVGHFQGSNVSSGFQSSSGSVSEKLSQSHDIADSTITASSPFSGSPLENHPVPHLPVYSPSISLSGSCGMDPTVLPRDKPSIGPPPLTGFVRQSGNKK